MDYKNSPCQRVYLADSTDEEYIQSLESRIVRKGVVGVVKRDGRYLVIQRSKDVVAPLLYAFPGGGIEPGETQPQALIREFTEELGVPCRPIRRIVESLSAWNVYIAWWEAEMTPAQIAAISPSPREVAQVVWLTPEEIAQSNEMLASMRIFNQWIEENR